MLETHHYPTVSPMPRKKKSGRRPIPSTARRSEHIQLSLRKDEMRRVERVARESNLPVAIFVRDCLIECLAEHERELDV